MKKTQLFFNVAMFTFIGWNTKTSAQSELWGMTNHGGANYFGVIFEYTPSSNTFTKKLDFDKTNGSHPSGNLVEAASGKLYGMTFHGGTNDKGVLFEYDPSTSTYSKKLDFDIANGYFPLGSLVEAANGKLYGMTNRGGTNDKGVLFEFDPSTSMYVKKLDFNSTNGAYPHGSLVEVGNSKLYGMTSQGGTNGNGVIFEYDPSTNTYAKKLDFNSTNGAYPIYSDLVEAGNGKLYSMTNQGGTNGVGVMFEYDPSTNSYSKKLDFDNTNGAYPHGSLVEVASGKLYGMTYQGGVYGAGVMFEYDPSTSTYAKMLDFDGSNGRNPYGSLVEAGNGKLYGMTNQGGPNNIGVMFEFDISTSTYTKKLNFDYSNGAYPSGSLMKISTFVGLNENVQNKFSVHPNPNSGNFSVAFGQHLTNATITIQDILGKAVYNTTVTGDKHNIQLTQAKGIYFVNIQTQQGERTTLKLVVE